jgi:hypothetical protein
MCAKLPQPALGRDLRQLEARRLPTRRGASSSRSDSPSAVQLVRPCTGRRIETLPEHSLAALIDLHRAAASRGEVGAFVPASGAATRMFRELIVYRDDPRALTPAEVQSDAASGRADAAVLLEFVDYLNHFAFQDPLERTLEARGERLQSLRIAGPIRTILMALLDPDGLDYAALPKGLVPFHVGATGPRTAFQEHLAEAALHADEAGRVRMHATVPVERADAFRALVEREGGGMSWDVTVAQDPASDARHRAIGQPFRDLRRLLSPAGHGALVGNLAALPTAVAFVRNVDNVAAEAYRAPAIEYARVLIGRLCELRERAHGLFVRLDAGDDSAIDEGIAFVRDPLGREVPDFRKKIPDVRRVHVHELLHRPIRVCGMVPNTGEPGGGPFWVRSGGGQPTRQIVETAEIDPRDPAAASKVRASTHFNPVFMALSLRDPWDRALYLEPYIDSDAVIVTRRSAQGKDLVALERPGLWNGAMARWNTVFVEVPLDVFHPVKTVLDLLRPEHQPR